VLFVIARGIPVGTRIRLPQATVDRMPARRQADADGGPRPVLALCAASCQYHGTLAVEDPSFPPASHSSILLLWRNPRARSSRIALFLPAGAPGASASQFDMRGANVLLCKTLLIQPLLRNFQ